MPRSSDIDSQGESISSRMSREMPKVLIADDSRFQRQMLASLLLPKKFEVIFAVDALQTWMMALRSTPDLILLDIKMQGGTGIEVLKRLRVSNKTQQIPVIVVSGNESATTEVTARELGALGFIHKPVDQQKLSDAVGRALGLQANAS